MGERPKWETSDIASYVLAQLRGDAAEKTAIVALEPLLTALSLWNDLVACSSDPRPKESAHSQATF
jgi:hypothetical protein